MLGTQAVSSVGKSVESWAINEPERRAWVRAGRTAGFTPVFYNQESIKKDDGYSTVLSVSEAVLSVQYVFRLLLPQPL